MLWCRCVSLHVDHDDDRMYIAPVHTFRTVGFLTPLSLWYHSLRGQATIGQQAMTTTTTVQFYSFSREFDLRYVLADFIVLTTWVSWIWRSGWKYCMLRGLLVAAKCYYIDAVVWYNTPIVSYDDEEGGEEVKGYCFNERGSSSAPMV